MKAVGVAVGLTLAAAHPAWAVWGPFVGAARVRADAPSAGQSWAWEAGVIAVAPEGQGFWQFGGGRTFGQTPGASWAVARLDFKLAAVKEGLLYAGVAEGHYWFTEAGADRRAWATSAQAGFLLSASVLRRGETGASAGAGDVGPEVRLPRGANVGAELGWQFGPAPLKGLALRVFLTVLR